MFRDSPVCPRCLRQPDLHLLRQWVSSKVIYNFRSKLLTFFLTFQCQHDALLSNGMKDTAISFLKEIVTLDKFLVEHNYYEINVVIITFFTRFFTQISVRDMTMVMIHILYTKTIPPILIPSYLPSDHSQTDSIFPRWRSKPFYKS